MNIEKEIKKILIEKDMLLKDLAEKLGVSYQNLYNKMQRNNFRVSELEEILNALGYDLKLKFIKR